MKFILWHLIQRRKPSHTEVIFKQKGLVAFYPLGKRKVNKVNGPALTEILIDEYTQDLDYLKDRE